MKHRIALLAGIAAVTLATSPASAQLAVICPTCASEVGQMASWAKQASDMVAQINQLRSQYMMLTYTYNAIAHATDVGGIAAALGGVTRTYLPDAAGTMAMVGQGSRLFGNAGGYQGADRVFNAIPSIASTSASVERWTAEMERREIATANAKAIAEAGLADMQERMAQLAAAEARVAAAQDGTEVAAVGALINTSRANLAAHSASVASIRLALHAEDRAERQRGEQMEAQGAAQWSENSRWAVDALGGGGE